MSSVLRAARAALLVLALGCFVEAAIGLAASASGRPVLTWIAAGLALLTVALLVDFRRL